jgi:hypothetical protein
MFSQELISALQNRQTINDELFDQFLPQEYHSLSNRHFTSIHIAQTAAEFLCDQQNPEILDIGSGIGKFCLVGAMGYSGNFTGIEYRKQLHEIASALQEKLQIKNIIFKHRNIINESFESYNGFYMFNPFLEQKDDSAKINADFNFQGDVNYTEFVISELNDKTHGTRLVTYYISDKDIPTSFSLVKSLNGGKLKCFIKK